MCTCTPVTKANIYESLFCVRHTSWFLTCAELWNLPENLGGRGATTTTNPTLQMMQPRRRRLRQPAKAYIMNKLQNQLWNPDCVVPEPFCLTSLLQAHVQMCTHKHVPTHTWIHAHTQTHAYTPVQKTQEIEFLSLGLGRSPGGGNGNPLQYSCHLFLISSASVRSIPFLSFIEPIFA